MVQRTSTAGTTVAAAWSKGTRGRAAAAFAAIKMLCLAWIAGCASGDQSVTVYRYDPIDAYQQHRLSQSNSATWKQIASGHYPEAVREVSSQLSTELARHEPDSVLIADLYLQLGVANYKMGRPKESIRCLGQAIESRPDDWQGYFHRWQILRATGNASAAEADRMRGMKLNPEVFSKKYSDHGII